MSARDDLERLVRSLPDDAVTDAVNFLQMMQSGPVPDLEELGRDEAFADAQRWFQETRAREGLEGPGGGIASLTSQAPGQWSGRQSFGYQQDGWQVYESSIIHEAWRFTLIERMRVDRAARTLRLVLEIAGGDGSSGRLEHVFAVNESAR